ncbi:MAG TPA: HNH endonuclease family protein [Solirubrobacterales bacterium]|nr:HNH endonuclease family protein [Solirubrobacterales bacterium]
MNRLGNLTLVTQPLNSALSNAPWQAEGEAGSKREELSRRSLLLINQSLCQSEEWNEGLIDARGADLTERILRTWPGPQAPGWPDSLPDR